MSVRYTATWYDVTQARQQEHSSLTTLTQYCCDRQLGGTVYAGLIETKWRISVVSECC